MFAAYAAVLRHAPVGRLGRWRLTSFADAEAFVSGWRQVAEWALATQPLDACPILLRDENDPREFAGWWPFETLESYRTFRNSPKLKDRFAPLGKDAGAHR
jgi:hypothetical protein